MHRKPSFQKQEGKTLFLCFTSLFITLSYWNHTDHILNIISLIFICLRTFNSLALTVGLLWMCKDLHFLRFYFFIWNPFIPFSVLPSDLWFMHKSYSNVCSFVSTFKLSGMQIHCLVLSVISMVMIKSIWTLTFEIHTDVHI